MNTHESLHLASGLIIGGLVCLTVAQKLRIDNLHKTIQLKDRSMKVYARSLKLAAQRMTNPQLLSVLRVLEEDLAFENIVRNY